MNINLALTDEAIDACCPIMRQLRPDIPEGQFLARVRELESSGYRLALARDGNEPVAVAGFHIAENLAWGRYLYVDDLVTLSGERSKGYGAALLEWLRNYGIEHGCGQIHLDSAIQRQRAHRFYKREGMSRAGYHFLMPLHTP